MGSKRNLSRLDQVLRIGVGLVLVYIGFIDTSLIGDTYLAIAAGVFGTINVVVGTGGYCPLYRVAGISTYCSD
ncbi:MAG: DUF2892 domain-containing protein [Desulfobacterales bacterium]|nr:DUF2892 domain-containing protein [Desulfobacterales bacterium]